MGRPTIARLLTGVIAILLADCAFLANDYLQVRRMITRELSTAGRIVAAGSATAVSLRDLEGVNRALGVLRTDENIVAATLCLRGEDKPWALYNRKDAPIPSVATIMRRAARKHGGSIVLTHSVALNGEVVGTLRIYAETNELESLLAGDMSAPALVMIVCILTVLLLTARLRRGIAQPVLGLVETSLGISSDRAHPPEEPGKNDDGVVTLTDTPVIRLSHVEQQTPAFAAGCTLPDENVTQTTFSPEYLNSELVVAKDRADEAARLKGQFLANMSYQIRTPMSGLIGMAQLTLETDLTPEQRKYVVLASNSAESLLKVIDNIIDLSRLEAGALTLDRQAFGLSDTLHDVMRLFSADARQDGLALLLDIDNDVPSTVIGDPLKFRQVMANLIDNALKFTDTGMVTVDVSQVFRSDSAVGLHFKVRDTGRGLAKDQFERALVPFEQVRDSQTRLSGGAGLGLAISNRLISMMGGSLWLDSEIGFGSTFHFTATFELSNSVDPPQGDLNDLRGARVLVADGCASTRHILQELLSRWQMRPTLATSGPEAIDFLRSATAAGIPFDIVLVDRHMIGIDGSAMAYEIPEYSKGDKPVITALDSSSRGAVTDFTRELCNYNYSCLVKPVSYASLLNTVTRAMHVVLRDHTALVPLNIEECGKHPHILVADDNVVNQALAAAVLTKEGYEVTVASDGAQVLDAYDRGGLDMILMDVQMPHMSGLEATRLIRLQEAESGGHITILALTAHAMAGDRERCLGAGMDDYVSKPVQVTALRNTINQWLHLPGKRAAGKACALPRDGKSVEPTASL